MFAWPSNKPEGEGAMVINGILLPGVEYYTCQSLLATMRGSNKRNMSYLVLWLLLAIADVLSKLWYQFNNIQLKWPNDICKEI